MEIFLEPYVKKELKAKKAEEEAKKAEEEASRLAEEREKETRIRRNC